MGLGARAPPSFIFRFAVLLRYGSFFSTHKELRRALGSLVSNLPPGRSQGAVAKA